MYASKTHPMTPPQYPSSIPSLNECNLLSLKTGRSLQVECTTTHGHTWNNTCKTITRNMSSPREIRFPIGEITLASSPILFNNIDIELSRQAKTYVQNSKFKPLHILLLKYVCCEFAECHARNQFSGGCVLLAQLCKRAWFRIIDKCGQSQDN